MPNVRTVIGNQLIAIEIAVIATYLQGKSHGETPPTAQVVSQTAIQLRQAKKLTELEKYLTVLSKQHPNRIIAVVGEAFLDYTFHGDIDAAK